jgi:hypothetical protein
MSEGGENLAGDVPVQETTGTGTEISQTCHRASLLWKANLELEQSPPLSTPYQHQHLMILTSLMQSENEQTLCTAVTTCKINYYHHYSIKISEIAMHSRITGTAVLWQTLPV